MVEVKCNGLPADWVNAWLAAVGATVLDSRIQLHWTTDAIPLAVLSTVKRNPVEVLVDSWPTKNQLEDLPIAQFWRGSGPLERRVTVDQFVNRVRIARGHPASWALSSTMTDLCVDKSGLVAHAPFDPSGPGSIKWLHHRLAKLHREVPAEPDFIYASLLGTSRRIKNNGLGFDMTRIGSLSDKSEVFVDPVIECLAFFGLSILPLRGLGVDERLEARRPPLRLRERQKGWRRIKGSTIRRFAWPAWSQPLNSAGIDALLDTWKPEQKRSWSLLGIHAGWRSVSYRKRGSADTTRAHGAERI